MSAEQELAGIRARHRITHEEARDAAYRFVNHYFGNTGRKPEITIPADPETNSDIVLLSYIEQQDETVAALVKALEEALGWCPDCYGSGVVYTVEDETDIGVSRGASAVDCPMCTKAREVLNTAKGEHHAEQ